jgi:hypothetical protein
MANEQDRYTRWFLPSLNNAEFRFFRRATVFRKKLETHHHRRPFSAAISRGKLVKVIR